MEIIFGAFLVLGLAIAYYGLRGLLTGKPGPFDTMTYVDDGNDATYQEIVNYLEDREGPQIVLKMSYYHYNNPNYYQRFLILKSQERNARIRIEVHL